ncbi:MAG: hypothetical protein HQL66_10715 [Magnetococcales bacterium]|nr:hypothetical protein [Magnetococcales bacterium]
MQAYKEAIARGAAEREEMAKKEHLTTAVTDQVIAYDMQAYKEAIARGAAEREELAKRK